MSEHNEAPIMPNSHEKKGTPFGPAMPEGFQPKNEKQLMSEDAWNRVHKTHEKIADTKAKLEQVAENETSEDTYDPPVTEEQPQVQKKQSWKSRILSYIKNRVEKYSI